MSNSATTELQKLAATYEERLKGNPDYIAWLAIQEAIKKISAAEERALPRERDAHQRLAVLAPPGRPKSQAQAAYEAIESRGEPMTIHQLISELPKFGAEVGGKDKAVNLASNLSRAPKLHPVKWKNGKAWWFVDKDPPGRGLEDLLS